MLLQGTGLHAAWPDNAMHAMTTQTRTRIRQLAEALPAAGSGPDGAHQLGLAVPGCQNTAMSIHAANVSADAAACTIAAAAAVAAAVAAPAASRLLQDGPASAAAAAGCAAAATLPTPARHAAHHTTQHNAWRFTHSGG
jgi:hypothetical protein